MAETRKKTAAYYKKNKNEKEKNKKKHFSKNDALKKTKIIAVIL